MPLQEGFQLSILLCVSQAQKKRKLGVVDECREESKSCIDVKLKFALC